MRPLSFVQSECSFKILMLSQYLICHMIKSLLTLIIIAITIQPSVQGQNDVSLFAAPHYLLHRGAFGVLFLHVLVLVFGLFADLFLPTAHFVLVLLVNQLQFPVSVNLLLVRVPFRKYLFSDLFPFVLRQSLTAGNRLVRIFLFLSETREQLSVLFRRDLGSVGPQVERLHFIASVGRYAGISHNHIGQSFPSFYLNCLQKLSSGLDF